MINKNVILLGPTAVGKTRLAVELAQKLNGEIISADSMQVYRGMDIGTAKPSLEERKSIPHHLIDIRNPDEEWTVSDFANECNQRINELKSRGKTPLIVGGTGLYLRSLFEGFSFAAVPADKGLRARLEKNTTPTLYAQLSNIDPVAAQKIHANDKKRIIRALEVFELTGKPISKLQKTREEPRILFSGSEPILIGINLPREELYQRINQRVDAMLKKGLIDEVKGLLAKGYSKNLNAFQALGYKEAIDYLDGKWNKEEMTVELKKRTRHFARRQMTWFRRFEDVNWFGPEDADKIIEKLEKNH